MDATTPLVLASASPRRAALLGLLGLTFEVEPADVDERVRAGESGEALARRLAVEKARAVAGRRREALVVGSDTVVIIDDEVLGKPADADEAVRMLLRLGGRTHIVATGIAVVAPGGSVHAAVETVRVRFRALDEALARAYVGTGEPMDKAGAYGIQGMGAALVEAIEGDYFAVMGLPIVRLLTLLEDAGWRYDFRGLERT